MLFNSIAFALFLPTVIVAFWTARGRSKTWVLLVASYVFYGWWDVRFLSLIAISTLTDYSIAIRLENQESNRRRALLATSAVVNLGMLATFKYWDFFVESAASLISGAGLEPNLPVLQVILPVGISFYTFQTLSYTIDVYRGRIAAERDLDRFALFVAFFPQLVAGPIERASRLLPQLRNLPHDPRSIRWGEALGLIGRGLFRKLVIADGVAGYVNTVYAEPNAYGQLAIATAVIAFSLQIYGDFAGYTDIARGVAKLFGVDLMVNFKFPYSARGFSEFWRRWHISLSTWLRDYLYIPLGGNRGGPTRTYVNLMVTMLLGGLWHGAGWGFIVWGGLHGLYLGAERIVQRLRTSDRPLMPTSLVFLIVTLTWIPFRAESASDGWAIFTGLFGPLDGRQMVTAPVVVGILAAVSRAIDQADERGAADTLRPVPAFAKGGLYGLGIVAALLLASPSPIPFIYFQF